jgi:hypothetical protein
MTSEISTVRGELIAEIERKMKWFRLIGISGLALAAAVLYSEITLSLGMVYGHLLWIYNPLLDAALAMSMGLSITILAPLLAVVAGGGCVKILLFLADWNKRYDFFRKHRRELEEKYLPT